MVKDIEKLRRELYANSPFDLGSDNDNKYRDAIDTTLGEPVLCRDCKGTGIDDKKHIHCKRCSCSGMEPLVKA